MKTNIFSILALTLSFFFCINASAQLVQPGSGNGKKKVRTTAQVTPVQTDAFTAEAGLMTPDTAYRKWVVNGNMFAIGPNMGDSVTYIGKLVSVKEADKRDEGKKYLVEYWFEPYAEATPENVARLDSANAKMVADAEQAAERAAEQPQANRRNNNNPPRGFVQLTNVPSPNANRTVVNTSNGEVQVWYRDALFLKDIPTQGVYIRDASGFSIDVWRDGNRITLNGGVGTAPYDANRITRLRQQLGIN